MAKRSYTQVHEYYLVEWLGITYPPGIWRTNVRLGDKLLKIEQQAITEEEKRYLYGFLPSCDAVVTLPNEVHLIEAMVRHEPGAGEDLLKYQYCFKHTTGYEAHAGKTLKLMLLTPLELGFMQNFYESLGIKVVYYHPAWIDLYLHRYPRHEWRGRTSFLKTAE